MQTITDEQGRYYTQPRRIFWGARLFPSLFYYGQFIAQVFRYSNLAKQGKYGDEEWWRSSLGAMLTLETVGVQIDRNSQMRCR